MNNCIHISVIMNLCDSYSISKMSDTITRNDNFRKILLLYSPGNIVSRERLTVVGLAIQTKGIFYEKVSLLTNVC